MYIDDMHLTHLMVYLTVIVDVQC